MEFIFTDPATDFSSCLKVIKSYHEDFIARGVRLLVLAREVKQHGMSENLANQCMDMYCHYSHANHLHHKDEEQALFPVLIDQSTLVIGMIERLMMDHEEIETSWDLLADKLNNPQNISDLDQFLKLAIDFENIQREHLTREDEDFSPRVREILSVEDIKQIGQKMFEFRQLGKK
ncbi:MAG: hemerythrin domain-containing protein [Methylococcales symbiont of Iophon sp. n. MRB-2018]|nr:MAG: hemerythrin domain-containing protein [Methylococcales symbiont of Iophon sp. n. MRB-2018]KAF3980028.1 MAG: hemerythrin domain-containing protein [Methylococcales symbiont of Iophon sp. n. MRB-2018]